MRADDGEADDGEADDEGADDGEADDEGADDGEADDEGADDGETVMRAELVVIGAGPAGLAASLAAAARGTRVVLVDAATETGGQFYRQPAAALGAGGTRAWSSSRPSNCPWTSSAATADPAARRACRCCPSRRPLSEPPPRRP
ncbi:hypothetical protein SVIOM74S_01818 [Streptomyces violarus]